MKRLAAALLTALGTLATPAAASADELTIRMPGRFFDPTRASVVVGDTVTFRNTDFVPHVVRGAGGVFDTGPIGRFGAWSQRFDQPGELPYVCTLHAFMAGRLDIVAATLDAGSGDVLAGEPIELSGRAPAGTAQLTLERSTPQGGWTGLAAVSPAPDGTFRTSTPARAGAAYRVTGPAGSSRAVAPRVIERLELRLAVRGRKLLVRAPAGAAGYAVAVEVYSPWRYAWGTRRRARLDDRSRATIALRAPRRAFARVALSRRARGPVLVHSRVVRLWSGRTAQDPDTITPPGPGHGGHGATPHH